MRNQDHRGVALKTGERPCNCRCYEGPSYGVAITEMSNEEFLEKDLQVHTYKTNILFCVLV